MKLVKGCILSSKPISIAKASSVLTRFLSTKTGAPPAVATYLKRAAASLEELIQVNRVTRARKTKHKHKNHQNVPAVIVDTVEHSNFPDLESPREEPNAGKDRHFKKKHKSNSEEERGRDIDLRNPAMNLREEGFGHQENFDQRELDGKIKNRKKKKRDEVSQSEVGKRELGGDLIPEEKKRKFESEDKFELKEYHRKKSKDGFEQKEHHRKKKRRKNESEN